MVVAVVVLVAVVVVMGRKTRRSSVGPRAPWSVTRLRRRTRQLCLPPGRVGEAGVVAGGRRRRRRGWAPPASGGVKRLGRIKEAAIK